MRQDLRPDISFVWNIFEAVLQGPFAPNELGKVILPFVMLRRIDCSLEPVNENVRTTYAQYKDEFASNKLVSELYNATKVNGKPLPFYNTSNYTLLTLLDDPINIDINFRTYLNGFNDEVKDILDKFQFEFTIARLLKSNLLFNLIQEICKVSLLTLEESDDYAIGFLYDEITRITYEEIVKVPNQHFAPHDVARLMSVLLFDPIKEKLSQSGSTFSIYDPACGTGGMMDIGKDYILDELCPEDNKPNIVTYGQEIYDLPLAIAKSRDLITGDDATNFKLGNTLTNDLFPAHKFDFIMANPPFKTSWKMNQDSIIKESVNPEGRFQGGLPSVSDSQMLFMQHIISKMTDKGSRIGILTDSSPLSTGEAGTGESSIRKWIIEHDLLECIVALPNDLFPSTSIGTYLWILTNSKDGCRKGKVQLINGVSFFAPAKKILGNKRNDIREEDIRAIMDIYNNFENKDKSRVFNNNDFGYFEFIVEQPKRKADGSLEMKSGQKVADPNLRSTERVRIDQDIMDYFRNEVLPHIDPESWIDFIKTRIGYKIDFQRYFFEYKKPKSSIDLVKTIGIALGGIFSTAVALHLINNHEKGEP